MAKMYVQFGKYCRPVWRAPTKGPTVTKKPVFSPPIPDRPQYLYESDSVFALQTIGRDIVEEYNGHVMGYAILDIDEEGREYLVCSWSHPEIEQ